MDETQIEQIAVNTLTPFIGRLFGWMGGVLSGVGVTISVSHTSAESIATALVGLCAVLIHELIARRSIKKTAQSAYIQGSTAAGEPLAVQDLPPVKADMTATAAALAPIPPANVRPIRPIADSSGSIRIPPASDGNQN